MERREVDVAEETLTERMQRFHRLRQPLYQRINAAHDEGDYETRDRLLGEVEALRTRLGLH